MPLEPDISSFEVLLPEFDEPEEDEPEEDEPESDSVESEFDEFVVPAEIEFDFSVCDPSEPELSEFDPLEPEF